MSALVTVVRSNRSAGGDRVCDRIRARLVVARPRMSTRTFASCPMATLRPQCERDERLQQRAAVVVRGGLRMTVGRLASTFRLA